MIRLLITGIITLVAAIKVEAQFVPTEKELAEKVKECTLAVVPLQEDEKRVQYLTKKKPEELDGYRAEIEAFNTLLEESIKREWNISKNIEFITPSQAEKFQDNKDPNYCILEVAKMKNYKMGDFYSMNPHNGFNTSHDQSYHHSFVRKSSMLQLIWAGKPKTEIALSYVPEVSVPQIGINFMVQHLKNQIINCVENDISSIKDFKKIVKARNHELADKTLLLYDPMIGRDLAKQIDKGNLDKYYKGPLEVVDSSAVKEVVVNHKEGYAYPVIVPAGAEDHGRILYNYFFVDPKDASVLYMTGKSGGQNGTINFTHIYMLSKASR